MPITLGCPSCGKRFRARDESAGKKVKCPYCQAAVQVPAPDEPPAGAGTAPPPVPDSAPVPLPPSRPVPPPARPLPASPAPKPVLASPDDWGALPAAPAPSVPFPPPARDPAPEPFPPLAPGGRGGKDRPKPAKPTKVESEEPAPKPAKGKSKGKANQKTPEEILARGWRSVRRGLFWVQFALLWLSLIGFVEFGKTVYVRAGNELPRGDGADWVSIEGYINSAGPNSAPLTKPEILDLALYGVPVLMAGLLIVFGRMIASGAPRNSGARGLFTFSALFGLVGFAALLGSALFDWLLMKDVYKYTRSAFLLLAPLAEFWFLTALTASGVALKRPKAARAVGAVGFVFALAAFVVVLGWDLYVENWRPKKPDDEVKMYEQAAFLLGWLLLVGMYWRAVRSVRVAAREFLDAAEDGRS
ncbi:zinc ribbon domain-containing protein [Frigoriglobus tundricola]|uniref:Uncharacterized protein n=1 Tax=Frigoriglobus tundricola TaxID=2774151 RepID=A0A6M5YHF4_9BACT|nr:hypothetical protein [Frigoriglobus tundricola]QJW92974.1 hypothetical protein FTUN_0472 [Frigoriglobus tundricola]